MIFLTHWSENFEHGRFEYLDPNAIQTTRNSPIHHWMLLHGWHSVFISSSVALGFNTGHSKDDNWLAPMSGFKPSCMLAKLVGWCTPQNLLSFSELHSKLDWWLVDSPHMTLCSFDVLVGNNNGTCVYIMHLTGNLDLEPTAAHIFRIQAIHTNHALLLLTREVLRTIQFCFEGVHVIHETVLDDFSPLLPFSHKVYESGIMDFITRRGYPSKFLPF